MKPDSVSKEKPFLKSSARWAIAAAILAALATSAAIFRYALHLGRNSSTLSNPTANTTANAVSALGHLRPEGEIIRLSAPMTPNGLGSRVAKLFVSEGDRVKQGQVVAILDSVETLQASVQQAREEVEVAQANLARVKAGAKTGEIAAQEATIARLRAELQGQLMAQDRILPRLKAELSNAQREYQRYRQLFQNGVTTASQLDSKHLFMTNAQEQLSEARVNRSRIEATFDRQIEAAQATLNQIAEVRPIDLRVAQTEVKRAIASVTKARADLNLAYIRAPINGKVLQIYTRVGELVGDRGIVALGQTQQMNVVAEVYELDIKKIRLGQKATITSNVFSGKLRGIVTRIGSQVNPQEIFSTDPTADINNRIVEVKIRLNPVDSQKVSQLSNLQVNVVINLANINSW